MNKNLSMLLLALVSIAQVQAYDSNSVPVSTPTKFIKWSGAAVPALAGAYLLYKNECNRDMSTAQKWCTRIFATCFTASAAWVGYHLANWFTKEGKVQWSLTMLDTIEGSPFIRALDHTETIQEAANKAFPLSKHPLADAFDRLEAFQYTLKQADSILKNVSQDGSELHTIAMQELARVQPLLSLIANSKQELQNAPCFADQVHLKDMYTQLQESATMQLEDAKYFD